MKSKTPVKKIDSWQRMWFKGNKVWMALNDQNEPVVHNQKQLVKYQLTQSHQYWVGAQGLKPIEPLQFETSDPIIIDMETRFSDSTRKPVQKVTKGAKPPKPVPFPSDAVIIYTDGAASGNPGPAGIGAVLTYGEHRKEISQFIGHATNNIAELKAILAALNSLSTTDKPVRLHTDSSYAIGVLTKGWKAKANQALIKEIRQKLALFKDIELIKVKGHAGVPENERADELATSAISAPPL